MTGDNISNGLAQLRDTLENVWHVSRLLLKMQDRRLHVRAMEYKARKMAGILQMAEISGGLIVGLKQLAPDQHSRISAIMFRGWAIRDRVHDFVYPDTPFVRLDHFFKPERSDLDDAIMVHGEELTRLVSELLARLDRGGRHPR